MLDVYVEWRGGPSIVMYITRVVKGKVHGNWKKKKYSYSSINQPVYFLMFKRIQI